MQAGVDSKYLVTHVGFLRTMVDPVVAKVVAIAATLPSYIHDKYCRAFLGFKYDKW